VNFRRRFIFINFCQSERIIGLGCHVEFMIRTTNNISVKDHFRNIPEKLGPNFWLCGFEAEDSNVKYLR
jgi:hypothetical protein